jgi:hypothetical protein
VVKKPRNPPRKKSRTTGRTASEILADEEVFSFGTPATSQEIAQ